MEMNPSGAKQPAHQCAELIHRHADNPILTAGDWPYVAHTVFNAGACQVGDETTLLVRVEDRRAQDSSNPCGSNRKVWQFSVIVRTISGETPSGMSA